MRQFRKVLAYILVTLIILTMWESIALADYTVKTLSQNKWYKLKTEEKTNTVYKLKLKNDSTLTCKTKNQVDSSILEFEIYKDKNCGDYTGGFGLSDNGSMTHIIALAKGTYYIKTYDNSGKPSIKMSAKAVPEHINTSKATAISLKKDKKAIFTLMNKGPKSLWYKIKLTKQQKIEVWFDHLSELDDTKFVSILDSKGKAVAVKYDYDGCTTKTKQKAGTYYLRLNRQKFHYDSQGGYGEMYWN